MYYATTEHKEIINVSFKKSGEQDQVSFGVNPLQPKVFKVKFSLRKIERIVSHWNTQF